MPDAITMLDGDWNTFTRSASARAVLARWVAHGTVPAVANMNALIDMLRDPECADARDELVYRLAILAGTDRDACRVVLRVVRPGLAAVARHHAGRWGWEESASMTVAAAFERVVTYPPYRCGRPAANIVLDVRNRLHRRRCAEEALEEALGDRVDAEEMLRLLDSPQRSTADELIEVVEDALATSRLSDDQARLILRSRLLDERSHEAAHENVRSAGTIRKMRRVAENRLALVTRSTNGLRASAVAG